ncbi:hypothetical protein DYY67_1380 [Candidatus Nitrosotalea sp. TS]|uniref:hypothetical protein n=1 Tax=Candidatus Nitrosotalea sp. TS TaxID=2341020 RepID=UPI00140DAF1D|nr:hypothetical protein [Candidatus Nitrosotalea sp. TS]NHI03585.1 hypothetical protein [Candidatus Nitrosotalea sp. TS]
MSFKAASKETRNASKNNTLQRSKKGQTRISHPILSLQRKIGNQAVMRLIQNGTVHQKDPIKKDSSEISTNKDNSTNPSSSNHQIIQRMTATTEFKKKHVADSKADAEKKSQARDPVPPKNSVLNFSDSDTRKNFNTHSAAPGAAFSIKASGWEFKYKKNGDVKSGKEKSGTLSGATNGSGEAHHADGWE